MSEPLESTSDAGLIARVIAQRDQHAFRQLVLRYQSPLRRWARRLCNGDIGAGDDLAQEVLIKAYRSLASYRGQARFSTWLYRIAFNLAASQRRLKREQWQAVAWEDASSQMVNEQNEPIPSVHTDIHRDLDAALAQLSQPQQLALRLSLEEEMTQEEVAQIMDLPLGTVKTHLLRGKQKLRELMVPWRETVR